MLGNSRLESSMVLAAINLGENFSIRRTKHVALFFMGTVLIC